MISVISSDFKSLFENLRKLTERTCPVSVPRRSQEQKFATK
jgi:hypothetical protein